VPVTEIPGLMVAKTTKSTEDLEKAEYLVRVKWDKTVPESKAIKERGFLGVQHTIARPKDARWPHTVERLKAGFGIPA
jgi:hypothetical protein